MKTIYIIMSFLLLSINLSGQYSTDNLINGYNKLTSALNYKLPEISEILKKKNIDLDISTYQKKFLKIIPVVKVSVNTQHLLNVDTAFNKEFYIHDSKNNVYYNLMQEDSLCLRGISKTNILLDKLIKAVPTPGFCMIVYLLDKEQHSNKVVCYHKDDSWYFFSIDGKSFNSYTTLIEDLYGSFEKYNELIEDELIEKTVFEAFKINTLLDAKNVLKNSWALRLNYNKNDTLSIISRLKSWINSAVNITAQQNYLIEKKIDYLCKLIRASDISKLNRCTEKAFNFYGFDIRKEFAPFLTAKQIHAIQIYFQTLNDYENNAIDWIFKDVETANKDVNSWQKRVDLKIKSIL